MLGIPRAAAVAIGRKYGQLAIVHGTSHTASGTRALRAADYAAVMSVLAKSSPTNSKASRAAAAEA